jgi:hypothetical protein
MMMAAHAIIAISIHLTLHRFAGDASKPVMARADDLFEQAVSKLRGMVYTGYGAIEIMVRAGFRTPQSRMQL